MRGRRGWSCHARPAWTLGRKLSWRRYGRQSASMQDGPRPIITVPQSSPGQPLLQRVSLLAPCLCGVQRDAPPTFQRFTRSLRALQSLLFSAGAYRNTHDFWPLSASYAQGPGQRRAFPMGQQHSSWAFQLWACVLRGWISFVIWPLNYPSLNGL